MMLAKIQSTWSQLLKDFTLSSCLLSDLTGKSLAEGSKDKISIKFPPPKLLLGRYGQINNIQGNTSLKQASGTEIDNTG